MTRHMQAHNHLCMCEFVWLHHVEHSLGCGNLMFPPDGASFICIDAEMHKSHFKCIRTHSGMNGSCDKWKCQCPDAERASRITLKDLSGGLPCMYYINGLDIL